MVSNGKPVNVQSREVSKLAKSKASISSLSPWKWVNAEAQLSPGAGDQGQLDNTANVWSCCFPGCLPSCLPPAPETLIISWTWYNVCLLVSEEMTPIEIQKACRLSQQPWGREWLFLVMKTCWWEDLPKVYLFIRTILPFSLVISSITFVTLPQHWWGRRGGAGGDTRREAPSELKIELSDGVASLSQAGPGDPLHALLSLHWSWK